MILSLIGLPGTGKSTVGNSLSKFFGVELVETDILLQASFKCSIPEYFVLNGEEAFRLAESDILFEALQIHNTVLSTGGGVVVRSENRRLLKAFSHVVYLDSEPEDLLSRLTTATHRPLFHATDPLDQIKKLWLERAPLYLQTAHSVIKTKNKNEQQISREIVHLTGLNGFGGVNQRTSACT